MTAIGATPRNTPLQEAMRKYPPAPNNADQENEALYSPLRTVLDEAYNQSAKGKGKRRHSNGKPFNSQPIMEIARMVGVGYHTGQAMKKCQEATTMASRDEREAAVNELLGAIVYCAAAVLLIREK